MVIINRVMASCKINQIFLGEVASVQVYGAFVRIPGSSQQGLIHKSQVSTAHVDDVSDILQRGDRVWCKVISVGDDNKVALSMKYVNQGNGKDLDPNGVEQQRDAQKKKVLGRPQKKAIHLEAVLNTTCTKCGTPGHLSKDCFMSPDGKKYELIPEMEEVTPQEISAEQSQEKEQKQKKTKKKKKSKKYEKDSDEDSSDSDREKRKKRSKKSSKDERKKKKKKRKYDSGSSDDSSSNSSSHDIKAHKRKTSESLERSMKRHKHSKHN